jgi:monoterpene epsilon-lactone hydrolase
VSPQAETIKSELRARRAASAASAPTLSESRAASERVADATAEPSGVAYDDVDAATVRAQWVTPELADPTRVVLYFHGGGYAFCSMRSHSKLVGHLARAAGTRALNVDFRRAPEHPHPAALNDALTAYQWLLDQGIEPRHVAVAGDSAGGGLATALLVKLRDEDLPLPAAGTLISPWVDLTCSGDSMTARADVDPISDRAGAVHCATLFLDGGDPTDPYASPLFADLAGLPPLYIQVGEHEVFFDDAMGLATRTRAAGGDVQLDAFPGMWHAFQLYAGNVPEADEAISRIGRYLRACLGVEQS